MMYEVHTKNTHRAGDGGIVLPVKLEKNNRVSSVSSVLYVVPLLSGNIDIILELQSPCMHLF